MRVRLREYPACRILLALGMVGTMLAAACTDPIPAAPSAVPTGKGVHGISISPVSATLHVGDTIRVRAVVTARGDSTITWTSSRPEVAQVDSLTGLTTAFAPGIVTVTATARAERNLKAAAQITVLP